MEKVREENDVFSIRVKELRTSCYLTMQELGEIVGVTKSTVSQWENYGFTPRIPVLKKLSRLFNVSIDWLVGNDTVGKSYDEVL